MELVTFIKKLLKGLKQTGADADVGYITVGGHNTIPLVAVNGCVALKCDPTPNRIWANLCFQASC